MAELRLNRSEALSIVVEELTVGISPGRWMTVFPEYHGFY